ncbi:MAG: DUF2231 domain-containing protein [Desulfobacterales bacterium]
MKEFDRDELARYGGEDGQPAYIAHQDQVIDVSVSKLWKGGLHMKRHHAGKDMTTEIQAAPHGPEVLDRFPKVGVLKKENVLDRQQPVLLIGLINRFPMLRRHPHPMTVHFPIVFMASTTMFTLLYLFTGVKTFETTAFHCLGAGVMFSIVAILTGYYTWWLNYLSRPLKAVMIKKRVSVVMLLIGVVAFVWRICVPDVLDASRGINIVYLLLVLSFFPLVSIIGWFGAELTFPIERE